MTVVPELTKYNLFDLTDEEVIDVVGLLKQAELVPSLTPVSLLAFGKNTKENSLVGKISKKVRSFALTKAREAITATLETAREKLVGTYQALAELSSIESPTQAVNSELERLRDLFEVNLTNEVAEMQQELAASTAEHNPKEDIRIEDLPTDIHLTLTARVIKQTLLDWIALKSAEPTADATDPMSTSLIDVVVTFMDGMKSKYGTTLEEKIKGLDTSTIAAVAPELTKAFFDCLSPFGEKHPVKNSWSAFLQRKIENSQTNKLKDVPLKRKLAKLFKGNILDSIPPLKNQLPSELTRIVNRFTGRDARPLLSELEELSDSLGMEISRYALEPRVTRLITLGYLKSLLAKAGCTQELAWAQSMLAATSREIDDAAEHAVSEKYRKSLITSLKTALALGYIPSKEGGDFAPPSWIEKAIYENRDFKYVYDLALSELEKKAE